MASCPICFSSPLVSGISLPCSHRYCAHCIFQWAEIQSTCPLCRAEIQLDALYELSLGSAAEMANHVSSTATTTTTSRCPICLARRLVNACATSETGPVHVIFQRFTNHVISCSGSANFSVSALQCDIARTRGYLKSGTAKRLLREWSFSPFDPNLSFRLHRALQGIRDEIRIEQGTTPTALLPSSKKFSLALAVAGQAIINATQGLTWDPSWTRGGISYLFPYVRPRSRLVRSRRCPPRFTWLDINVPPPLDPIQQVLHSSEPELAPVPTGEEPEEEARPSSAMSIATAEEEEAEAENTSNRTATHSEEPIAETASEAAAHLQVPISETASSANIAQESLHHPEVRLEIRFPPSSRGAPADLIRLLQEILMLRYRQ